MQHMLYQQLIPLFNVFLCAKKKRIWGYFSIWRHYYVIMTYLTSFLSFWRNFWKKWNTCNRASQYHFLFLLSKKSEFWVIFQIWRRYDVLASFTSFLILISLWEKEKTLYQQTIHLFILFRCEKSEFRVIF